MPRDASTTRGHARKRKTVPVFITKSEMAAHLCLGQPATIDRWVAQSQFPPPHSRPGERHLVWLRRHWNTYVATGEWPREAWPSL